MSGGVNIGMVHDVGAVLGLQDPKVPVHIGHNARATDTGVDRLRDNGNPMRVEGRSLNRLTLLTFHGSGVSYSLPRQLLEEENIIKILKFL